MRDAVVMTGSPKDAVKAGGWAKTRAKAAGLSQEEAEMIRDGVAKAYLNVAKSVFNGNAGQQMLMLALDIGDDEVAFELIADCARVRRAQLLAANGCACRVWAAQAQLSAVDGLATLRLSHRYVA